MRRPMPRTARIFAAAAGTAIAVLGCSAAASVASAERLGVLADDERRQASDFSAVGGPFDPVVGRFDYGTAENRFGAARSGHVHEGQDMFAPAGTDLVAVSDAVVVEAGADAGRGNYAAVYDRQRERTYVYFHMLRPAEVRAGEKVAAGARLGALGCTGSCWGPHLHFEVHEGRDPYGPALDPLPLLRDWTGLAAPL
ncbi:MAG: peptidoglycan DD-metalloendopeptidase family protein [Solirubrobacterales bacterium]|nr:peptidoglycan DD-metalloendopeptidase family protein [Solirubrobacterales bacterium]